MKCQKTQFNKQYRKWPLLYLPTTILKTLIDVPPDLSFKHLDVCTSRLLKINVSIYTLK